tara:strand:+ start:1759 stop:1926 length:168 start_codon:yes stop_codon:yes gene_type:complete
MANTNLFITIFENSSGYPKYFGPFTLAHPIEFPMFFLCIIFVVFMVFNLAMDDED